MAEKGFGVKEVNLIGASGTPTITSPNNLNLNAVNVAISTNASIGGNLTVSGTVGIAGTLTYEDVTNIDSVGIVTAREGVFIPDTKELKIGNTAGSPDLKIFQDGSDSLITNTTGVFFIQNTGDLRIRVDNTDAAIHCVRNGAVELYHAGSKKLETSSSGATVTGTLTATTFSGSGASLTSLPAANLTGTLPAISGANLTNLPADTPTNSDIQVVYTVTANGSSAYRFGGNGIVSTEDNPDVYLIRGLKYRFINNSGGSHPFQIRQSSGGSAYSSGVTNNGAASGNIDFQVPYSAPSHLYYQCTAHGGMVGNLYIRGAGGQNTNVGVTTFSGGVNFSETDSIIHTTSDSSRLRLFGGSTESVNSGGALTLHGVSHSSGNYTDLAAGSGGHIQFRVGTSEKVRILSDGKVRLTNSSGAMLDLRTSASTGSCWVQLSDSAGNQKGYFGYGSGSNETLYVVQQESANIDFYTGGSTKMSLTTSGQLAIRNTGSTSTSVNLLVYGDSDNSDIATFSGGDFNRGLKLSTSANGGQNDQNVIYNAQGDNGQHIFSTGGNIVGRLEHDQSGFITENTASGDGDTEVGVALQNDYSSWAVIYKNDWIGQGTGWGTFWAGNSGARYRRVSSDTNPNEHVMVGSGQKRFTFDLDNGNMYYDGAISGSPYDYAEYFEWEDGNPSNEDRRGYSVFVNSNGKIEKATDSTNTSDIIGVISGTAAILGDAAVYDWQGKWKVDEWGTVMRETVKQVSWKDEEGKRHSYDHDKVPSEITIPSDASYRQHTRKILNPDYDETKEYVPRDMRQEWDPVGLLGKVRVRDDSPKNPNWKFIKVVNGKKMWLIR